MRYSDELFSKGLTIKLIDKLRKVKRYGSKTEAAKVDPKTKDSTGYTGALSKLEKLVGPRLMAKHSSALTTAGEDFLRVIEKFCTELDDFGALHGDRRTDVIVGSAQNLITSWWLPLVYPDLRKHFPAINFVFRNLRNKDIRTGLENGDLDLGIMGGGKTPSLKKEGRISNGYQLVVPKSLRAGTLNPKSADFKRLEKHTFIVMEGGSLIRSAAEEFLKKKGMALDNRLELSSWIQISTALEAGLGFAVVPDPVAKNLNSSRITGYPLENEPRLRGELALFYSKIRLDERPAVERIKDRILKHMD